MLVLTFVGAARNLRPTPRGAVDPDLRVHGAESVSAVPGALGVNPQITIMARATRLALNLRSEPCPS